MDLGLSEQVLRTLHNSLAIPLRAGAKRRIVGDGRAVRGGAH